MLRTLGLLGLIGLIAAPPAAAQCGGFLGEAKLTASDAERADRFGHSVAASGDTVVVGAFRDGELGTFAGSAWVRVHQAGSWEEEAKLLAVDGEAFDNFGAAVAISGDTIVVGVPGDDDVASNAGAAFVYLRSGGSWSQEAKLVAADGLADAGLGSSVAIDGNSLVLGAPFDLVAGQNRGSAYVFVREAGAWRQEGKLTTTAVAATASFGLSVALSGDRALVGAPDDNDASFSSGSAHAFRRVGGAWSLELELRASDEATEDAFGHAVALSGDTALVGAWGDDDAGDNSGSVYVFAHDGLAWREEAKLRPADGDIGDQFGLSVALDGSLALAGSRADDDAGSNSGSAYLFAGNAGSWRELRKLVAADAEALDQFGAAVGLSGGLAVVGAEDDDDAGSGSGSAHVFCAALPESDCGDGVDDDGDGLTDCEDPDCEPAEVNRLDVARSPPGAAVLDWTVEGGVAAWDLASDRLETLHADGAARAPCVATGLPSPSWLDDRPPAGGGSYYLVRASSACSLPERGWGRDSLGAERPACP